MVILAHINVFNVKINSNLAKLKFLKTLSTAIMKLKLNAVIKIKHSAKNLAR